MKRILRSKDFTILDSIRGIASLYVAIAHCRGSLWIGGNEFMRMFPVEIWDIWDYLIVGSSMLTRLAVEFVIVFFLLSGFSISHSLAEKKSAISFYKRRFIRIYPSYVVALVWAGIVFLITRYFFPEWYDGSMTKFAFLRTNQMNNFYDFNVIVKNLLYMPSEGFISPFWSLTYEVIFYVLAPFLVRKVNLYVAISLVLFLLGIIVPGIISSLNLHTYIYNFLFVYNIYFAAGVFIYSKYDELMAFFLIFSKRAHLIAIGLLLLLIYATNFYFQAETSYSFIASAIFSFLLIFYFLRYQIRIPWLIRIGSFSYTLYITHVATIFLYLALYWAIMKPGVPYILNYLVWVPAVFFCLIVAYWQYMFVESRTKLILNRMRKDAK